MGYEIDFLPVGKGERGGDAIALRWGNLSGKKEEQTVMVIDGGYKETGENLVAHIQRFYGTNEVDIVVCTHPDADHSSGLAVVLEKLDVKALCIHKPWAHADEYKNLFQNGKITDRSLKANLKESLENAYDLEAIATRKGIKIHEPFSNLASSDNSLVILSPSLDFYKLMLANFRETPKPKESIKLFEKAITFAKETIKWIVEDWGLETLTDPEENSTSAENNSSAILLLQIDGQKLLFTGDAGVEALIEAYNKAISLGIDLKTVDVIQIPHHGSKNNIGPSVLNAIIDPKLSEAKETKTAFVSCPQEGALKHPSKKVLNAFKRRGVKVFSTEGKKILHPKDAPDRGWQKAIILPFYDKVEEFD